MVTVMVGFGFRPPPSLLKLLDEPIVDRLGHAIKVDKQTEKNLIGRRTVFVYSRKIV